MRVEPVLPPSTPVAATLVGLDRGRTVARRRAARRRVKNAAVSGVMFALLAGAIGAAGWFGYQFFLEEQSKDTVAVTTEQRSTSELIDHLEEQPRWNGPGNPTFGVEVEHP